MIEICEEQGQGRSWNRKVSKIWWEGSYIVLRYYVGFIFIRTRGAESLSRLRGTWRGIDDLYIYIWCFSMCFPSETGCHRESRSGVVYLLSGELTWMKVNRGQQRHTREIIARADKKMSIDQRFDWVRIVHRDAAWCQKAPAKN